MRDMTNWSVDPVLPIQLVPSPVWTPEQRLIAAMMDDALLALRQPEWKRRQAYKTTVQQARDWFASDETEWLFSFLNCCRFLGLDPDAVRQALDRSGQLAVRRRHAINPPAKRVA